MKNTLLTLKIILIQIIIFSSYYSHCQCSIEFPTVEMTACEEDLFDVSLNFEYENTSDQFSVSINGVDYGTFNYEDLPVTITSIESDCLTEYVFVVTDVENDDCLGEVLLPLICCDEECDIVDLVLTTSECDGDSFDFTIDFDFVWGTSSTFDWEIPGVSGGTAYFWELPLTVQVSNDLLELLDFVVNMTGNPDCFEETFFENPCFDSEECDLFDLAIETTECDGGEFSVTFNFEYTGTTNNFFDWEIPGVANGFAEFGDLPLTIGVENTSDEILNLFISENDNPDCAIDGSFDNPCFGEECFIGELDVEVSECDGNFFFVVINFEYENTGDQFTVNGNGNSYGTFSYSDLPITIDGIESDCSIQYEFVVNDVNNNDCASDIVIGGVCCEEECDLFDLAIETTECDGGEFSVTFNFEYTGTTNNFFDWEIPGVANGFAEFGDLPLTIGVENTSDEILNLFISENDNPDCAIDGSFDNPCFGEECFIGELDVEVSECDGNFFFVVINFEYENTGDQFTVNGNGNSYGTFSYSDLPITIDEIESDCSIQYEFVVNDVNNNDCASDIVIGGVCCEEECDLFDLAIETTECDGGEFGVTFDFEYTGTTNNFFNWEIPGVGDGTAEFSDLPLTIGIENSNTSVFELIINENDNPDCAIDGSFDNPCFGEECFIGELDVEVSECDGNFFFVVINFEYENTGDQFTVNGNGNSYGTFSYSDLPITIDGIESDCSIQYEFVVNDVNDNDCASDIVIGGVCCEEECDLFDLVIETTECDGGFFEVIFDFEYVGTTNNLFDWEIPGIASGFAEFSDLPLTVGVEIAVDEILNLFISENDNPDCAIDGSFDNPCFGEECFIGELDVEVSECDGNFFFVVINFEYENTGDQFTVNGNGNNYGTFSYSDLPITIDGIESDCSIQYEFVVNDVNNNDCASDIVIGEVCCEEECDLFDLVIETTECDGGEFGVTFDFEYTGTTNNFFNWEIPGVGDGTAEFSDLPLTIGIENSNTSVFELIINENDNPDCAIDGSFDNPCFGEECFIGELDVEVSECDGNFFFVVINFEYENTGDQFTVNGNGNNYGTFSYSDLPITIDGIESDCSIQYEFVVNDVNNDDCASDIVIGEVCCEGEECDLFELNFDVSECDGDFFSVEIDFEYTGNTNEYFVWEISGIGNGMDLFSNLPISIEIENSTDPQFTFFANEIENPNCSIVETFGNPCYDSEECVIDAVGAEVIACEEDLFDVEINFEYENVGSTFSIEGNGVEYGTFSYNDLPVILTGLTADCGLEYEFVVSDNENEQCSGFVELGIICCEDFNQIEGLESETVIDGEVFRITFDITNTTLKGCDIEVFIDGELYETLADDESSFTVGPFDCDQDNVIEIKLINSCSGAEWILMFDLSDINCITDVDITLDSIDLKWNMIQKTLTLEGEVPVSVNVQLVNAQGALILAENDVKIGWSKNLNNYPSGLYFVRIVDNGSSSSHGFIKKVLIY